MTTQRKYTYTRNKNPVFDTRKYEVQFHNRDLHTYTANVITELFYSQEYSEEHDSLYLADIMDHKSNASALINDDNYTTSNGRKVPKRTVIGQKILHKWKDKSTCWVPLNDVKESYPVQVAEYSVNNKLSEEPSFHWLVIHAFRERDIIIKKIKSIYLRKRTSMGQLSTTPSS